MAAPDASAIRTYGCQMNVHDSEKVANLLHPRGLRRPRARTEAPTCS